MTHITSCRLSLIATAIAFSFSCNGDPKNKQGARSAPPSASAIAGSGEQAKPTSSVIDKRRIAAYHRSLDGLLLSIMKADAIGAEHNKRMLTLLRFARQLPVSVLAEHQPKLEQALKNGNREKLLSYTADYVTRLLSTRTPRANAMFKRLSTIYKTKATKSVYPMWIFLRRKNESYRAVTGRATETVVRVLFSEWGRRKLERGVRAERLLADAVIAERCKPTDDTTVAGATSILRRGGCDRFYQIMTEHMTAAGMSELLAGVAELGTAGIPTATSDCLESLRDDTIVEFTQRLDAYEECSSARAEPGVGQPMPYASGENFYDSWINRNRDVFNNPSLLGGDITQWQNGNGDNMEKYTWNFSDGSSKSVDINHSQKSWTETTIDSQGRVTHVETSGPSGSGSYDATFNENGTLGSEKIVETSDNTTTTTETQYDDKGNLTSTTTTKASTNDDGTTTTEKTVTDADGNVASSDTSTDNSGADTTQQPPDETINDPCIALLHNTPEMDSGPTKLATQILPNPDNVAPIDDPCLQGLIASGSNPGTNCVSVMLCLESQTVDENCKCTSGGTRVEPPHGQGPCAQMMCEERCDPATGLCVGGSNGDIAPGLGPPGPLPVALLPTGAGMTDIVHWNRVQSHGAQFDLDRQGHRGGASRVETPP